MRCTLDLAVFVHKEFSGNQPARTWTKATAKNFVTELALAVLKGVAD